MKQHRENWSGYKNLREKVLKFERFLLYTMEETNFKNHIKKFGINKHLSLSYIKSL